jgi:hypothetical protein
MAWIPPGLYGGDVMSEIESNPTHWLFHGPLLGLSVWEGAPAGEPVQAWPSVSFVHSGAFLLHAQGRAAVIDATSVLLQNPGEALTSEHPFGGKENGSTIYIRPDILLSLLSVHDPSVGDRPESPFPRPYLHGLFRAELLQRLLVGRLRSEGPTEEGAIEAAILKVLAEVARECRPGPAATWRMPKRFSSAASASGCTWRTSPGRCSSPPTISAVCSGTRRASPSTAT